MLTNTELKNLSLHQKRQIVCAVLRNVLEGPRSFPLEFVENVCSWIGKHPNWTFKFWTDQRRDAPCNGMKVILIKKYPFPLLGRCYASSENWGEKSDVLKFEIFFHQGGVYVDQNANCPQSFEGMHGAYEPIPISTELRLQQIKSDPIHPGSVI